MAELRFAMIGCGFWAGYQLSAWHELPGARCVALVDQDVSRAADLADKFQVPAFYGNAVELFDQQDLDFVDIVTNVETHAELVRLAARRGIAAICQKPMAVSFPQASELVAEMREAGLDFLIHENWRWQPTLRRLRAILDSGLLGSVVRARIDYAHSFPVFDNQPFLKQLDKFILTDMGTHILDVARFLFGEPRSLFCTTRRMRSDIAGEDVATAHLHMDDGLSVTCNLSYASHWFRDRFPQTFVDVEGTQAGVTLDADCQLSIYRSGKVESESVSVPSYAWANPDYALIHSSMVDCQRNLVGHLRGESTAETTAEDNLKTLALVYGCYESAASNSVVRLETGPSDSKAQST
ncbi:MAG: Gfo/Idh/MocA family oxidoreductase [bacterium]|nr:Gfo/Idh/MocA family oxidoreductase [bacterium]